uniref:Uncharacterized protein n=1 Tax=uncultured Desulfobacterium sp. TaxID=201089 RepID=E1YGA7_9BACT|nr:unknown protein [uncultured Desulfobacterium sp.]
MVVHTFSKGYRNHKGFGWILVLEADLAKAFAPVANLKKQFMLIALGISSIAASIPGDHHNFTGNFSFP